MNKGEFVDKLIEKTGKTKVESERLLDAFDNIIVEGLTTDGAVTLGSMGKLHLAYRAPRTGVNPKHKDETYSKPESATASFRPSQHLRSITNEPKTIAFAKSKSAIAAD